MPYIKVDVGRINEYQRTIYAVRNRVSNISAEFSSIGYRIDEDIKDSGDIDRKIRRINSSLTDANTILGRMSTFLGNAALSYLQTEDRFSARAQSSGDPTMTNISALAETIAKKEGLDTTEVTEIIISGDYPMDEIMRTAVGVSTGGAFAAQMNKLAANKVAKAVGAVVQSAETAAAVPYVQPVQTAGSGGGAAGGGGGSWGTVESEKSALISDAVELFGLSEDEVVTGIADGAFTLDEIAETVSGKTKQANKFVQFLNKGVQLATGVYKQSKGASNVLFEVKNGYVIVSGFTRSSKFNELVKLANDGRGIGTRYKLENLANSPEVNKIFQADQLAKNSDSFAKKFDKVADKVETAANVVSAVVDGGSDLIVGANRVKQILEDDSLSREDKIADTAATVITTAVATALDVAAPFAGSAVQTAVTAAIPVPVVGAAVGWAAGVAVEKGMQVVADVVMSDAVVNQVSDSVKEVGQAVTASVAAVSDAAKRLQESKNAGEAVANTAKLVGAAVVAEVKVVSTIATQAAKTAVKVATETAKTVAQNTVNTVKKAASAVSNFFKKKKW